MHIFRRDKNKIEEYIKYNKEESYTYRENPDSRHSSAWSVFRQIIDNEGKIVDRFYFCIECKTVVYSSRIEGSTTQLLRHPCVPSLKFDGINIDSVDMEKLKTAAAKFVCFDLRPFNALECPGLRELVTAGVELGKKYP